MALTHFFLSSSVLAYKVMVLYTDLTLNARTASSSSAASRRPQAAAAPPAGTGASSGPALDKRFIRLTRLCMLACAA
jgi:hypothetical protein